MSWISMLVTTYNNCPQLWGVREEGDPAEWIPLLLVGQSTQNAHIDVLLDERATLVSAAVITDKQSQPTIIPCTEGSIGRSGLKIAPHPLHDKLQYVAGDYVAYGGDKQSGWSAYIEQINAWCDSAYAHPKVCVVRDFLSQGDLIERLMEKGIMAGEEGKLIDKPSKEQKAVHPLLAVLGNNQMDAFVRFRVMLPGDVVTEPWLDPSVNEQFVAWQRSVATERELCYVTGKQEVLATNHPAKIRNTGDKAKLISANDHSGYTYRGRFHDDKQVVGVGYESSQKAHNMLKWLVSRVGFRNDTQVFVAWGTRMQKIPNPAADSDELFGTEEHADGVHEESNQASEALVQNLRRQYATRLRNAMAGYGSQIGDADDIVVMGIDAATTGRMAIIFYRELSGSDFLRRIEYWHTHCCWLHYYKLKDKKPHPFVGAPAPHDIALAAYGKNIADKLRKATVERLLRCIVDGKPVPRDILQNLVRRASRPVSMEGWEWRKTLSIACAAVRRNHNERLGGGWTMALDVNSKDRDYLFGRLLAYAQHIESSVQYATENAHRQTNAERMMHAFALRPAKTWAQLRVRLQSYFRQMRNPGLVDWWNNQLNIIVDQIGTDGFNNQPLREWYLLGYSSQLIELRSGQKTRKTEEEESNDVEE